MIIECQRRYELTSEWKDAPLIRKMGLSFLLVRRDGDVVGFEDQRQ